jgi:hypothetical protein
MIYNIFFRMYFKDIWTLFDASPGHHCFLRKRTKISINSEKLNYEIGQLLDQLSDTVRVYPLACGHFAGRIAGIPTCHGVAVRGPDMPLSDLQIRQLKPREKRL